MRLSTIVSSPLEPSTCSWPCLIFGCLIADLGGFALAAPSAVAIPAPATDAAMTIAAIAGQITRDARLRRAE